MSVSRCLFLCPTLSLSAKHGLSPAFVWRKGPQTVDDGCVERSWLDAQVQ